MSVIVKSALVCAAVTVPLLAVLWGVFWAVTPRGPRVLLVTVGPDPVEALALEHDIARTEWLVCDTTRCAHMETPHRRDVAEYATCTWCGHHTVTPAPTTTPKDGAP